ncbi:hypothetical protein IUJ34_00075 [Klebsiella pneumoniae subsp. pneumoniae]|uniref:Uncharacterized protein n=1 Tax=Klebsiella pneumoniae subsp. pneumoniae TaxID=72407 RepID=A0A7S9E1W9_KLEPN|nr:hypothetical protein IUJ34_25760 [Klebsiella pneumoniae subsp. pneumoniae]QPG07555.1 hypothetical protein IUJ34_00075 [Klebsiella pneumoniae subsp. pneumoniae]
MAMVQAFRRTSESKHISKSEIKSFLEVVKPIKKKPQIQETTVCGKELSESVELIKELHLSSVKGVKKLSTPLAEIVRSKLLFVKLSA